MSGRDIAVVDFHFGCFRKPLSGGLVGIAAERMVGHRTATVAVTQASANDGLTVWISGTVLGGIDGVGDLIGLALFELHVDVEIGKGFTRRGAFDTPYLISGVRIHVKRDERVAVCCDVYAGRNRSGF